MNVLKEDDVTNVESYSDEELSEFEALILKKIKKAQDDYNEIIGCQQNQNGTLDTHTGSISFDEICRTQSKEVSERIVFRLTIFIRDLNNALGRIHAKNYGVCRITGKLIPKERLRIVPHTTSSVEGKTILTRIKSTNCACR